MSASWNTKWGTRRVRHDPPTLAEAIAAAQGFTNDVDQQIEFAAMLMGVDVADARNEARTLASDRRATLTIVAAPTRDKVARTVIVERRTSRRMMPGRDLTPVSKVGRSTR